MVKLEIDVPKSIVAFVSSKDTNMQLKRNALILYPYIQNNTISYGKAAEMLGIPKIDLIALYGSIGLDYFDMDIDEIEKDMNTIKDLRSRTV